MIFSRSIGRAFAGNSSDSFCARCSLLYTHKFISSPARTQNRLIFEKLSKSPRSDNTPMVVDERVKSKTLIIVKPNSYLFRIKRKHRPESKYLPTKYLRNLIREAFPMRSIYRADMSQGMAQLYEDINEQMDFEYFIKTFNMPNNTTSWMRVCELHVYLLCAKFRPEEYLGKAAIDYLTRAYFNDIEYRSRRLAPCTGLYKKNELKTMKLRAKSVFMAYDEGVQENDMVLAAAIWRQFFDSKCGDFTSVERLVKYLRVQLTHLKSFKFRDLIFYQFHPLFVPLSEIPLEKNLALALQRRARTKKRMLYSSTLPWINEKTYN